MTRDGGPGSPVARGRREADLPWEDTSSDPDPTEGGDIAVTRLRPGGRSPGPVAVLLAAVVVVALVKPWGGEERAAGPASPALAAPTARAASTRPPPATPPAEAAIREHCLDPGGWRVFAHEGTGEGTIRSWKSVVPAAGVRTPADPTIPIVPVGAPELEGLGYCAPWRGSERPPRDVTLQVWRIAATGDASPLDVVRLVPAAPTLLGGLYVPPATQSPAVAGTSARPSPGAAAAWPDGRYVFALRSEGYDRWWSVDVATGRPSPGPDGTSAAPGGAPPG